MDGNLFLALLLFAIQTAAGVAPMRWPQCSWLSGLIFWLSCIFAAALVLYWIASSNYWIALIPGVGTILLLLVWVRRKKWWRRQEQDIPSIAATVNALPPTIGDYGVASAIEVTNTTGEPLEQKCLVKILEMDGGLPNTAPRKMVLRTEGQINRGESGRFTLSDREPKAVPVLFQEGRRKDFLFLIDENIDRRKGAEKNKSKHAIPFPRSELKMLIGTFGGAVSGRYLLTAKPGPNWTLTTYLTKVAPDYEIQPKLPAWLTRKA